MEFSNLINARVYMESYFVQAYMLGVSHLWDLSKCYTSLADCAKWCRTRFLAVYGTVGTDSKLIVCWVLVNSLGV